MPEKADFIKHSKKSAVRSSGGANKYRKDITNRKDRNDKKDRQDRNCRMQRSIFIADISSQQITKYIYSISIRSTDHARKHY